MVGSEGAVPMAIYNLCTFVPGFTYLSGVKLLYRPGCW